MVGSFQEIKKAPKHDQSLDTKPNRYEAENDGVSGFSRTISVRAPVPV